jgi:hypothetical protein
MTTRMRMPLGFGLREMGQVSAAVPQLLHIDLHPVEQ